MHIFRSMLPVLSHNIIKRPTREIQIVLYDDVSDCFVSRMFNGNGFRMFRMPALPSTTIQTILFLYLRLHAKHKMHTYKHENRHKVMRALHSQHANRPFIDWSGQKEHIIVKHTRNDRMFVWLCSLSGLACFTRNGISVHSTAQHYGDSVQQQQHLVSLQHCRRADVFVLLHICIVYSQCNVLSVILSNCIETKCASS